MDVKDLIRKLREFPEDHVCVLVGLDGGWSNLESVKEKASTVELRMDSEIIFTSDRG